MRPTDYPATPEEGIVLCCRLSEASWPGHKAAQMRWESLRCHHLPPSIIPSTRNVGAFAMPSTDPGSLSGFLKTVIEALPQPTPAKRMGKIDDATRAHVHALLAELFAP
jgi:hypothetical protein